MFIYKSKIQDLIFWTILSFGGLLFVFLFKPSYMMTFVSLSFLPGIFYLLFKTRGNLLQALIFSSIVGILCGIPFEFVNFLNESWFYDDSRYLFPDLLFGIPLEVILWYFFWTFSVVQFYEYFVDQSNTFKISRKILFFIPVLIGWPIIYFFSTHLIFSQAYLVTGIASTFPALYFLFSQKSIFRYTKFLLPSAFLGAHFFVKELVALYHDYWSFSGDYLYTFSVFQKTLPIEEVFFWIVASPIILICYYELFFDDGR